MVNYARHNFWKPVIASSNVFQQTTNPPTSRHIQFTITLDEDKPWTLTIGKLGIFALKIT